MSEHALTQGGSCQRHMEGRLPDMLAGGATCGGCAYFAEDHAASPCGDCISIHRRHLGRMRRRDAAPCGHFDSMGTLEEGIDRE